MKFLNFFNWGCRGKNNISKPKAAAKIPIVIPKTNYNPAERKIKSEWNAKSLQDDLLFDEKLILIKNNEAKCLPRVKNLLEERKRSIDEHSNQVSSTNPFKRLEITEKSHEVTPDSDPSDISESNSSKISEEDHDSQHTNRNSWDTETSSDSSCESSDSNVSENDYQSNHSNAESSEGSTPNWNIDEDNKNDYVKVKPKSLYKIYNPGDRFEEFGSVEEDEFSGILLPQL